VLASAGSLLLRIVVGLLLAGHGSQKLFGWFGGGGFAATTGWIGKMGLRPVRLWALLASLSEFGGGILLVLGFLCPLGSLAVSAAMLMAIEMKVGRVIGVKSSYWFWRRTPELMAEEQAKRRRRKD
jgi:putative oxidoreductase